jgi:hypothetical protein
VFGVLVAANKFAASRQRRRSKDADKPHISDLIGALTVSYFFPLFRLVSSSLLDTFSF